MLNKNSAFISHSYISRFHAARNSEEIDLWNVFYKDILPFHLPAGETQFLADLYNEIVEASTHKPSVRSLKKPIDKFNIHLYNLVSHINKNVNTIYNKNFRNDGDLALNIQIVYLDENDLQNNLHEHFYLAYDRVRDGKTTPLTLFIPRIGIKILEDGKTIYKPQSHFNEAKLTAIALAVRFAAMTTTVITPGSFLALDDMLISLDMSNRAKVVDFLLKISDKYKIYLFTHDKMFFEYFKHKTKKNQDAWVYKEIYMDDKKTPYIRNSEDYLGEAGHYIKQHQYEIAGNFLRKAAELLCKNFLPNKWQLSPDYSRLDLNGLIHNCKRYAEESGMTDISVFEELDSFRKFILNPASHDSYDVVKYRYEVELCLQTLTVFKDIDSVPFLNRGDKLCFELKCKAPSIDIYKFELILCDNFRIIKQPGKTPLLSKGMINYRVIKNGEVGTIQSDNTTIKSFYDKCYEKSDKSKDANFFNSIIEAKSGNAICTFI